MLIIFLWTECLGINNELSGSNIVRQTVWPLEVTEVGNSVKNATKTFQVNHFKTVIPRILLLHLNSLYIGKYPKV